MYLHCNWSRLLSIKSTRAMRQVLYHRFSDLNIQVVPTVRRERKKYTGSSEGITLVSAYVTVLLLWVQLRTV
jgi:hypothetical protein